MRISYPNLMYDVNEPPKLLVQGTKRKQYRRIPMFSDPGDCLTK